MILTQSVILSVNALVLRARSTKLIKVGILASRARNNAGMSVFRLLPQQSSSKVIKGHSDRRLSKHYPILPYSVSRFPLTILEEQ